MSTGPVIAERAPVRRGKKIVSFGYRVTTTTTPPSPQIAAERKDWLRGFWARHWAAVAERIANEDRIQPC